jgi:outer membrane beta-barrel protein
VITKTTILALALPILSATAALGAGASPAAKTQAATKSNLSSELTDLSSGDKIALPDEKMYIVQDRAQTLGGRFEVSVGAAKNFNSNIYVDSSESNVLLTYHWSDRWFTSAYGSYVNNELTDSGRQAWESDGIYPNTSFVKRRFDATVGFNLLYGKARVTQDAMFYFDQYFALGGGVVDQTDLTEETRSPALVADAGFALWFGNRVTLRLGVKDDFFQEKRPLDTSKVHHVLGYSSVGVLLGGAG